MLEPVDIEFRINNGELEAQSRRAVNAILGVGSAGREVERETSRLGAGLKSLFVGLASTAAIGGFVREIINVRGEIQALEASFEVLLGNKQKADAMLAAIKAYAVESPLSLSGVSNAAQTLLSFNIEAEKVIPVLKQIGDISMGDEQKFRSLILAFSQMSSTGRLMGQDLNQMINAGFNPLQVIAEKTGKTIGELKKEMESGVISAEMVADAFRSATEEGGLFYGMTQKQAEGIKGLQAQLVGAMQDALNEIGKASEGVITAGYKVSAALIENYGKIGKILVSIIATYGAYRAALIATAIAQTGLLTLQFQFGVVMARLNTIATTLNATLMNNPYAKLTAVAVGLVTAMWALSDSTGAAEKAQKRYNEAREKQKQEEEEHKSKIESLIRTATSEAEATYKRILAMKDLQKEYPDVFKDYDMERLKLADILKIKQQIAEIDGKRSLKANMDKAEALREQITSLEKEASRIIETGGDKTGIYIQSLYKQSRGLREELKLIESDITKQKNAMWEVNTPLEVQRDLVQKNIDALREENKRLDEKITKQEELNTSGGAFEFGSTMADKARFAVNTARIKELEDLQLKMNASVSDDAYLKNKAHWEKVKKDAEAALGKLSPGMGNWDELKKKILEAYEQLKKYNVTQDESKAGKASEKAMQEAQHRLEAQQWLADKRKELTVEEERTLLEAEQKELDIAADGFEKRMKQNDLNYQRELLAIKEFEAKKQKEARDAAKKIYTGENGTDKGFDLTKIEASKMPAGLRPEDIQKQVSEMNKTAFDAFSAANKQVLRSMTDDYTAYEVKKLALVKKYNDLRAALDEQFGEDRGEMYRETLKNINRAEADEGEQLARQNAESTNAFRALNKVIEQEGRAALQERLRRLQEYLRAVAVAAGEESELYKEAYRAVKDARQELDADTIESYKKIAEIMQTVAGNMSGAGTGLAKAAAEISQSAMRVYDAFKKEGSTGEKVSSMVGLIANVTASLRDWSYEGMVIEDTLGEQQKLYDAIAASIGVANERLAYQKTLLDGLAGQDLVSAKMGLLNENANRQAEALKKLNGLQVEYIDGQREIFKDDLFGSHVENSGFGGFLVRFFTGGQAETYTETILKDIDTSALKTIDDWRELLWTIEEGGGMYNGKQVVESDIEALRALIDEYDSAVEEQKRLMEELAGAFTGTTADAISQSIADGFMSGKRSMANFAEDFETLMANAVKASFQINVTDALAKDFYQKFVEATQSDFMLTAEEIAALKEDYKKRIEEAGEQWEEFQKLLTDAGVDLAADAQKNERGGFETLSQETGEFLLGQFAAIRVHVGNIYDLIANMTLGVTVYVAHLAAIEKNTGDAATVLKLIETRLKRMETEGVKVL